MKKLGMKFKLLFSTKMIAVCVFGALMGHVTYYATNYMGMAPSVVGIVFMISKIFDGVTDFIAGIIIDRTHSRWGQARPYDLALIGYGVSIVLIYSAPDLSPTASVIYLFVMYTMVNSVFSTLTSCNEAPYVSNALETSENCVDLVSFTSIISLIFTVAASILVPQLMATLGQTKKGWTWLALVLVVPVTIIGLLRFLFIKEVRVTEKVKEEKVSIKGEIGLLFKNKYALIIGFMLLLSNICANIGNMDYYCQFYFGNIGLGSVFALSAVSVLVALILIPKLAHHFGMMRVLRIMTMIGAIGNLCRYFVPYNILVAFISSMASNLGFYPIWFMASAVIVDTMDYGEWKYGNRAQGILSCVSGIASKLGTALGAGLQGIFLGIAGYQGELAVQSESSMKMILGLVTWVPALICALTFIVSLFYDLDEKLPMIRRKLKERNCDNNKL